MSEVNGGHKPLITVHSGGRTFHLYFYHNLKQHSTFCLLTSHLGPEAPEYVVAGHASRLHPGDQFSRKGGRKAALRGALGKLDRPDRRAIWQAYWDKVGQP